MDSKVPPFSQWIQNLRCDITNILQRYKNVFIHRSKVAGLFHQLKTFAQDLKNSKFPDTPPNPSEAGKLRVALKLISLLREIVITLDKDHAINSILKDGPEAMVEMVTNFRKQFGDVVVLLKISKVTPVPIDKDQIDADNINDAKQMVQIINQYLNQGDLEEENIAILKKRLEEYQEISQTVKNNEEEELIEEDPIVPPEELEKRLVQLEESSVEASDFLFQKKIGSGAFAEVFMGVQKSTNKVVAIKKLIVDQFTETSFQMYIREVKIMRDLNHFAVLPFIGVTINHPYCLITEYMSGGCLFNRLHGKTNILDGTKKTIIALGIAYAMEHVHSKNYIHRDLKSLNILLNEDDYPFVCDFGISRNIIQGIMTGSIGTPQWMAPEVISSQHYDAKADVYSYGIILWELLMNEVPFRGLQPVQVMMSVVSRKNRPMIPPDRQGSLAKFIKACWDNDPKVRPSFESIVAAFESGKINFPGTNQDTVNAYRARFSKVRETKPASPEKPKETSLGTLAQNLVKPTESEAAVQFIANQLISNNKEFAKNLIANQHIIPGLIKACDLCNSPGVANNIIKIFTSLSKIPSIIKPIVVQKVIGIYVHFGTTQMKEILEFFNLNLNLLKDIKLNGTILEKFAGFLRSSDVALRVQATRIFVPMIEKKVYAKPESLKEILVNVINNIESNAIPELVLPSLQIIKMLLELRELFDVFIENHIFTSIVSISKYKFEDVKIYSEASSIFSLIIKSMKNNTKTILKEEDVIFTIQTLQTVYTTLPDKALPLYVATLSNLLQVKIFYSVITKDNKNEITKSFETFLTNCKSDQAVLLCLKICFALLCDSETQEKLATIAKTAYIPLMKSKSQDVASLAAACLIHSTLDIKMILNDNVTDFLKTALSPSNRGGPMELNALRLCGAFSSTEEGAKFLEEKGISTLLSQFIADIKDYNEKDNKKLKNKLAVMAISSYSKVFPISKVTLGLIENIIKMINQKDMIMYTATFLANAVIHPSGAKVVAKNFDKITQSLIEINKTTKADGKSDEDTEKVYTVFQLLRAMKRVVTIPEAMELIKNIKTISQIYDAALFHLDDVLFNPYLDLVSDLSCTENGKKALSQSNIVNSLNSKMGSLKKDDFRKFSILRIIARNSNY